MTRLPHPNPPDGSRPAYPPLAPLVSLGMVVGAALACVRVYNQIGVGEYGLLALWDLLLITFGGGATGFVLGLAFRLVGVSLGITARWSGRAWLRAALGIVTVFTLVFFFALRRADPIRLGPGRVVDDPRPPDIVVVVLDAVRADALFDSEGRIPEWAPNLRAMAAEGVVFEDAGAPSPWTLPSHASLLTGMSVLEHGASEEYPRLRPSVNTLAEQLHARGYRTVALVANPWLGILRGFSQGFERYFELWRLRSGRLPFLFSLTEPLEKLGLVSTDDPRSDKGARLASRLAERLFHDTPVEQPIFLFVNLIEAHPPFTPPRPYDRRFLPKEILARGVDPDRISQSWSAILTGQVTLSTDEQAVLKSLYQAEVAYMDAHLGRIIDSLRKSGRWDHSLVIVTSDHGCGIGAGRRLGAGFDLGEEMLHIPMIVHFPRGAAAGTRRSDMVYLQDVTPTALQLAGALPPAAVSAAPADTAGGRSLLATGPRASGLAAFGRPIFMLRQLLDRYPEYDSTPWERRLLATRGPRWKMVWSSNEPERLFDRRGHADMEDLALRLPDTLRHEGRRLERMVGTPPERAWQESIQRMRTGVGQPMEIDPETMEMLRSLGYIQAGVNW